MTMAMVTSPNRPTPITRMITTKHTMINKTTTNNKMVGTIQTINSNNNRAGDTMTNRGFWLQKFVNAAHARQWILQRRCQ